MANQAISYVQKTTKTSSSNEKKTPPEKSYYVNGRAQVIEMLKILNLNERTRLLSAVRVKNPALALELAEESFGFENLKDLKESIWPIVMKNIHPQILGISIRSMQTQIQRKILKLCPNRQYAENAFEALNMPLSNEKQDVRKAQDRVIQIFNSLLREKRISIN